MTLTLNFKGQSLKKPYLRNRRSDWHGAKRVWVRPNLWLELWFHTWLWTCILKVKILTKLFLQNEVPIGIERKGCELIWCWTNHVKLSFDLDLERLSRSNLETVISRNGIADSHGTLWMWCRYDVGSPMQPWTLTSTLTWHWFLRSNLKMKPMGYGWIEWWLPYTTLTMAWSYISMLYLHILLQCLAKFVIVHLLYLEFVGTPRLPLRRRRFYCRHTFCQYFSHAWIGVKLIFTS